MALKLALLSARHRARRGPARRRGGRPRAAEGYELREGNRRTLLPPLAGRFMLSLLGRGYVSRDTVIDVLWPDPDVMPETMYKEIHVIVFRLRRALAPFGAEVRNVHGQGYRLFLAEDR